MLSPLTPLQALRAIACMVHPRTLAPAVVLATSSFGVAATGTPTGGPSVKDVVEFTRIIQPRHHNAEALATQVSPDGSRAFIVTRKADVRSDRNRYEVIVLDIRGERLESGRPRAPATVLAVNSQQDPNYADPSVQEVRWADNRTLLMRARIKDAPAQVYKLDVATRRLTQLTFDPAGVVSYAITKDLRRIVYAVQVPSPPLAPGHRALVVGNRSFWSVKHGMTDLRAQQRKFQYLAVRSGTRGPARKLGEPFDESGGAFPGVSISPDGRWALLHRHDAARQAEWIRRYPLVAEAAAVLGPAATNDPRSYYSRPSAYLARHLVAYRLADGTSHVAIDAPDDAVTGGAQLRADRLWMGRGESVLIGGTHLPQAVSRLGRPTTGTGSYVVEYWPDSGRWEIVTALRGRFGVLRSEAGERSRILVRDDSGDRWFERGVDGGWKQVEDANAASPKDKTQKPRWTLAVNEAMNLPPDIEAQGPQGQKVRLTTLNPQYNPRSWGTMRTHEWRDAAGRQWDGGLMVPPDFDAQRRYPLVIQSYGFSASRFYLDGANQSDGVTSGFAGRAYMR
jgi:dipeptidyl aminopeptidase/acylaminoacyl peptidase